jgi:hypothetical protein
MSSSVGLSSGKLHQYPSGCFCLCFFAFLLFQLFAHGQWFSPGTPASPTTKAGRHDIAEILLKVALKHQKSKFKLLGNPTI